VHQLVIQCLVNQSIRLMNKNLLKETHQVVEPIDKLLNKEERQLQKDTIVDKDNHLWKDSHASESPLLKLDHR